MKATKQQKQIIHIECPTRDIKEEWVQWATEDVSKISTNDLSFDQANMILHQLGKKMHTKLKTDTPEYWAYFNNKDSQHKYILSLMYQLDWTVLKNGKRVPDMTRLGKWLQSDKCPRSKPLKQQSGGDLRVNIHALEQMLSKTSNNVPE